MTYGDSGAALSRVREQFVAYVTLGITVAQAELGGRLAPLRKEGVEPPIGVSVPPMHMRDGNKFSRIEEQCPR